MQVALLGYGFVNHAVHKLFPDALIYDPVSPETVTMSEVNQKADVAFVAVPTPVIGTGKLDTSIVESVVRWCTCPLIIIRSTLNPGTADALEATYHKNIVVVPEYLGETIAHPLLDEKARQFLIIGGQPQNRRKAIEVFQQAYNANIKIRQVTNLEAEVIKLSENRAIMTKVTEVQELYDVCELAGVDYYTVRDAVYGDDPRFNLYWTFVYPDKRGANSKCIPKDVYAWAAWAESVGYEPHVTHAILERNRQWLNSQS